MAQTVFVSVDGDSIGHMVGNSVLADDPEGLARVSQAIDRGEKIIGSWALSHSGRVIQSGGDEATLEVPAQALGDLDAMRSNYASAVGATLSAGVGRKLSEAAKALLASKLRGKDRVTLYDQEVEKEVAAAAGAEPPEAAKIAHEYLGKAAHPHSGRTDAKAPTRQSGDHEQGAVAEDQGAVPGSSGHEAAFRQHADDQDRQDRAGKLRRSGDLQAIKQRVAGALEAIHGQLPILGQLKGAYPQTYQSITKLVQSVIDLGREVQNQDDTLAKAEGRPKVWRSAGWGNDVISIPSANHPDRPAADKRYRDAIVTHFAGGDPKGVRQVQVPVSQLTGGNTLGVHSQDRLRLYRRIIRSGDVVPPVVVQRTPGGSYRLLDGTHRAAAAQAEGLAHLPALELRVTRKGQDMLAMDSRDWMSGAYSGMESRELEPDESLPADKDLDKEEPPAVKAHHSMPLPVGTTHNGQVKVRTAEGKEVWRGVRAGMIQGRSDAPLYGQNSHPVSSREPESS